MIPKRSKAKATPAIVLDVNEAGKTALEDVRKGTFASFLFSVNSKSPCALECNHGSDHVLSAPRWRN